MLYQERMRVAVDCPQGYFPDGESRPAITIVGRLVAKGASDGWWVEVEPGQSETGTLFFRTDQIVGQVLDCRAK